MAEVLEQYQYQMPPPYVQQRQQELLNTLLHDSASYQKYTDSLTGKFDKKGMTNIKYINVANSYS